MKVEKIIEYLKNTDEYKEEVWEVVEAVKWLRRNIPVRPFKTTHKVESIFPQLSSEEMTFNVCPACGHIIDNSSNYCSLCGQAILWEEDKC